MNLLNNIFNFDEIEIKRLSRKYLLIFIIFILMMITLLLIEKNRYYTNTFNVINEKMVLFVQKEYINEISNNNMIVIDNSIESSYSIKKVEPVDNMFMVSIKTSIPLKNISNGSYKVYTGKERLFEYIVRIIKK